MPGRVSGMLGQVSAMTGRVSAITDGVLDLARSPGEKCKWVFRLAWRDSKWLLTVPVGLVPKWETRWVCRVPTRES